MDSNQAKRATISGTIWKFAERSLAQIVSLIVSIILARILSPDDYSVVGIVTIFFVFANVIISGGLNSALIQKKDAEIQDYSTVLVFTLLISIGLYLILFFLAPLISELYEMPILTSVIRVMGLILVFNAFKSVICAYVSNKLLFRKFFVATLFGTIVSAVVGIIMAIKGYGCWALVVQQMTNSLIDTIVLFLVVNIKFSFKFSFNRFKQLFSYGWKIFVSSLIGTIYDETTPLIIGLKYSKADLAYYTKGSSFPNFINSTLSDTFSAVLFPVMSKMQDDKKQLLSYLRKFMQMSTFIIFPLMLGFFAISDNFVYVLLTEKWMSAAVYIRIFCVANMLTIIQKGNIQVIKAIGRSDITLILEIVKKTLYLFVLLFFIFAFNDPVFLAVSVIATSIIATIVNAFPNKKLIGYGYFLQIKDMGLNFLTAVIMAIGVYLLNLLPVSKVLLLIIQIIAGMIIYFLINYIIKNSSMISIIEEVKKMKNKEDNSHEQ